MSVSIRSLGQVGVSWRALQAGSAALVRVLGWPARVHRARRLMLQLGSLSDCELKDIGLVRQDLRDVTGLGAGVDPSVTLRARAEARRRRCGSPGSAL